MLTIGIDPDLHHTGLALLQEGKPVALTVCEVDGKLRGAQAVMAMARALPDAIEKLLKDVGFGHIDRAVVENQQIYQGRAVRPDDILKLGQVAGAAVGIVSTFVDKVYFPKPSAWKGSVPKKIHQRRIIKRMGWEAMETKTTIRPQGSPLGFNLSAGHWSHVLDAIGLAEWGATQHS